MRDGTSVIRILYETMEFFVNPTTDLTYYDNTSVVIITLLQLVIYLYRQYDSKVEQVQVEASTSKTITLITIDRIRTIGLPLYSDHCSICLNDFNKDDPVAYTACYHAFCHECILNWIEQKNSCPCCRTELVN